MFSLICFWINGQYWFKFQQHLYFTVFAFPTHIQCPTQWPLGIESLTLKVGFWNTFSWFLSLASPVKSPLGTIWDAKWRVCIIYFCLSLPPFPWRSPYLHVVFGGKSGPLKSSLKPKWSHFYARLSDFVVVKISCIESGMISPIWRTILAALPRKMSLYVSQWRCCKKGTKGSILWHLVKIVELWIWTWNVFWTDILI